ncbi:DUF2225 domain-containing protein [Paenibacillus gansuensis]|uniref:DUF2225 domain-containing protein n=1 Tax=Paenibacillus gansuensis TaxID=306542 RepID=A0ABW5PG82_9BACL
MEPLFKIEIRCQMCSQVFQTSRVRPSFKRPFRSDEDFCGHYKEVNPDFYVVRVCPYCGYASTENFAGAVTDRQRDLFHAKVGVQWVPREYGGVRTAETALETYKLALLCAQIKGERGRVVAGLLHHIAWLYRYEDHKEQEQRFLAFALEAYTKVYEEENGEINNARLMYLMGELNRRTGHYYEAVKWFGRVINDKKIMDSAMIRASREQWMATRTDMLAAKVQLPDEMKEEGIR